MASTHIIDIATAPEVIIDYDKRSKTFTAEDSTLSANGYKFEVDMLVGQYYVLKNSKTGNEVKFYHNGYFISQESFKIIEN